MKKWIGAFLVATGTAFAVASGCGNPEIASICPQGVSCSDASVNSVGGGAGVGGGFHMDDGGPQMMCPHTCAQLNADCGFKRDPDCGVTVDCTATCPVGQYCGGGGDSKCGDGSNLDGGTDGGPLCTPSTCAELGAECGIVNDTKCPGTTVDCTSVKTCASGEFCMNGKCTTGDGGVCVPKTACDSIFPCGTQSDGCSSMLTCGMCNGTDQCVVDTATNGTKCQPTTCQPTTTCSTIPGSNHTYTCGTWPDNCGNPTLNCGPTDCGKPGWSCGGGGVEGVCGCAPMANGMPGTCSKIPDCPMAGTTTSLTGKVYDPAGNNPLYNVLVYIPNDPNDPALKTFPQQISCDVCGASAAGDPVVSTFTGVDGKFTLDNVPAGTNIPLVIQLGRWRRQFTVNIPTACGPNSVTDKTLLMPSTQAQGNIPLMAMMTGNADSLECVLRKMGIASTEFTNPAGGGRVQFYLGAGNSGQKIDDNTPGQAALFGMTAGQPTLNKYDMAILACQGTPAVESAADQLTLRNYANKGGRVFMTHYSYSWATQSNPGSAQNNAAAPTAAVGTADNWAYGDGVRPSDVAAWHIDESDRAGSVSGIIDKVTNPKANAFQGWLEAVGASTVGSGQITVNVIRHDTDLISSVPGQTQQWLYRNGTNKKQCAVGGATCNATADCSKRCSLDNNTLCATDANCTKRCAVRTSQTCNQDSDCNAMVCQNRTQQACTQNSDCTGNRGPCVPNPCSATVNTCTVANSCDGFDYTGTHIPLHFTFNTPVNLVQDLTTTPPKIQCGRVLFSDFHVQDAAEHDVVYPNQCGAACNTNADCGAGNTCAADKHCMSPMTAQEKLLEFMIFDLGSCVPPPKVCTPKACPAGLCGVTPDGCGGLAQCSPCPTGQTCGVNEPNKCGSVSCTPITDCAGQGPGGSTPQCGYVSDHCTGVVNCGMCPAGQVCVGGMCKTGSCTPDPTCPANIECGKAADNCGNQIDCGTCPNGGTCINGKCNTGQCIPTVSCDSPTKIECGSSADNCGNKLDCGNCPAGSFCSNGKCIDLP